MSHKILALIFFVTLIQNTLGHGWLVTPIPRGFAGDNENSASQSGPCGPIGNYNATITIGANEVLPVTYSLGGGHDNGGGPGICRFSIATSETNQAEFDLNVLLTGVRCVQGSGQKADVTIVVETPGLYYLQFRWLAGDTTNWYNCVILNVTEGPEIQLFKSTHDTLTTTPIDAPSSNGTSVTVYHAVSLPVISDNYKHVVVRFNGTNTAGLVNLTASNNLPARYNSGLFKRVQPYMQSISLCNIPDTTKQIYVGLFPDNEYVGNVSFIVSTYEGELNFNGRDTAEIHAGKGEYYYFRSQAYSELTSTRRIIVEGRGGNAYLSGPFNNCNKDTEIVTEPAYCIDLPLIDDGKEDNPPVNYYGVFFDDAYDGKVQLQKGKCANYSGVSSLVVSIVSLLALLLLF